MDNFKIRARAHEYIKISRQAYPTVTNSLKKMEKRE